MSEQSEVATPFMSRRLSVLSKKRTRNKEVYAVEKEAPLTTNNLTTKVNTSAQNTGGT